MHDIYILFLESWLFLSKNVMLQTRLNDDCLKYLNDLFYIKLIFYYPSWLLQLFEFVWTLCSSAWVVNNFLLIDATDRSKISSDQKRFFIALSLYPLSFFANTPFKCTININIFKAENDYFFHIIYRRHN